MGLVETLVEQVSLKSVLVLVPGLVLGYFIVAVVVRPAWQEFKLSRMPGARAPTIKSKYPLSEDARHCLPLLEQSPLNTVQASTSSTTASARP